MFGRLVKKLAAKHGSPGKPCGCKPAKRHRDCAYCGVGWDCGWICGVCKAQGIDGPVIRGTSARRCSLHAKEGR